MITLILILLIASLIELLYGTRILGLLTLLFLVIILAKEKRKGEKGDVARILIGLAIIAFVLIYNNNGWGTLDVMLLMVGASLILTYFGIALASFTLVMASFFVMTFLLLYSLPHSLGIPLPYYYGHYLVALPVVDVLRHIGYDVKLSSMRTITVNGVQPVNLIIELSCFGWYSLLLALGAIVAYSRTMRPIDRVMLIKLLIVTIFAVYLANLLRIAILVVVAYDFGIKTMLILHAHIGWILFAIILLPLIYVLNNSLS